MENKPNASEDNQRQEGGQTPIARVKPEDMLDLEKGAAAMDQQGGITEKIGGRTISGSGSGPGTGDAGGDFDRPGTEGLPAINDFVDPEGLAEPRDNNQQDDQPMMDRDDLPQGGTFDDTPGSGYPGGGAVRTAEDRIPPGKVRDDDSDFSPESPLNDAPRPTSGG